MNTFFGLYWAAKSLVVALDMTFDFRPAAELKSSFVEEAIPSAMCGVGSRFAEPMSMTIFALSQLNQVTRACFSFRATRFQLAH